MGNTLKTGISLILAGGLLAFVYFSAQCEIPQQEAPYIKSIDTLEIQDLENYKILHSIDLNEEQEAIRNEIMYGEIELLAQLIEAEAGNQDDLGKRYVADVVMNRVDSKDFPDTVEEVIFQQNPAQFACVIDGNFDKAGWHISDESFQVALEEYSGDRQNTEILYFSSAGYVSKTHLFQYGDHYFSK